MPQLPLVQFFVRAAKQGDSVSVLITIGDEKVEIDWSPAEALEFAWHLIRQGRTAQFGEFRDIKSDELDHEPSPARSVDIAYLALESALLDIKPAVATCAAVGTS